MTTTHSARTQRSPTGLGPFVAVFLLAAIVALGTVVRAHNLGRSLWIDELHTAWTVAEGPGAISARAAAGNYSPAYFYVVWAVTRLAGMNEAALRLPSFVAGILLIVAAWAVVKQWTGTWSLGLLAALTVAVDPWFIFLSSEARPYALVHLLGLAHMLIFRQMLIRRPTFAMHAAWCIGGAALFYLHYTSALLIAAELVCYVVLFAIKRFRPECSPGAIALDLAVLAVLCCPMGPHLLEVAARRDNWAMFIHRRPARAMLTEFPLEKYLLMPAATVGVLMASLGVRPCFLFMSSRRHNGDNVVYEKNKKQGLTPNGPPNGLATTVVLLCCWFCVPIVTAWTLTELDVARLFFRRYLMIAALAPILLGSLIGTILPGRWWRAAFVAVAAAGLLLVETSAVGTVVSWVRFGRPESRPVEDWRGAVGWVNEWNRRSPLPVLVRSALIEADALADAPTPELAEYCLLPVTGLYRLDVQADLMIPLPTRRRWQPSPTQLDAIRQHGGARLMIRGRPESANSVTARIANTLRSEGLIAQRSETKSFRGVTVVRLRIAPR